MLIALAEVCKTEAKTAEKEGQEAPYTAWWTTAADRLEKLVANAIIVTLTAGSSQLVSFSTTGLPIGATSAFSTSRSALTCLLNVTINTSAITPVGTS